MSERSNETLLRKSPLKTVTQPEDAVDTSILQTEFRRTSDIAEMNDT